MSIYAATKKMNCNLQNSSQRSTPTTTDSDSTISSIFQKILCNEEFPKGLLGLYLSSKKQVHLQDCSLILTKHLGTGNFGTVYSAIPTKVGKIEKRLFAVKIPNAVNAQIQSGNCYYNSKHFEEEYNSFQNERACLEKISSSTASGGNYFAQYYGTHELDESSLFIFLKYYPINLTQLNLENLGLSLDRVSKYGHQLVLGLDFLHNLDEGIIHTDLKPDNILFDHITDTIKISDFGSSLIGREQSNNPAKNYTARLYRAPEIQFRRPFSTAIDRWSLACILFEMHTCVFLFRIESALEQIQMITELLGPIPAEILDSYPYRDNLLVPYDDNCLFYEVDEQREYDQKPNVADLFRCGTNPRPNGRFPSFHDKETVHTQENYDAFRDLLSGLLQYKPEERYSLDALKEHKFFNNFK